MQTFSDNITQKRLSFIRHHPLYVSSLHRLEELEKTMDPAKYVGRSREQLLDVARIAYILNLEGGLGLSRDLIYTAALLHDIGKSRQYEEGIPHETASAALAERILSDMPSDLAFTAEEQLQILTAIRGHRKPRSGAGPLESLLYKSDKMSRTCFACPAEPECNWDSAKKNTEIQL